MPSADPNRQKLTQLRKLIIQHFSLDELRVLCSDLGLEYEDLPGDTRTTKMHGLIEYLQRRGELSRLLDEVIEQRSNVDWPSFADEKLSSERYELASQDNPQSFIHEKSGLEMLLIPSGEFLYGEEKELKFLSDFWMAKTSVTNAHYAKFVQEADTNRQNIGKMENTRRSWQIIRLLMFPGRMQLPIHSGRACSCLQNSSGKRQREGKTAVSTLGATSGNHTATRGKRALARLPRLATIPPLVTVPMAAWI